MRDTGLPSPGGIWTKMKPIDFGDFLASRDMRDESWRRRLTLCRNSSAAPNPAAATGAGFAVQVRQDSGIITQNIDNLIRESGFAAHHVVELHGNTTYATCLDCTSATNCRGSRAFHHLRRSFA